MNNAREAAKLLGQLGGAAGIGISKRRSKAVCQKGAAFSRKTLEERFHLQVRKGEATACWPWMGAKNKKGYGQILDNTIPKIAHRVCWQIYFGAIPVGMHVCHRCDNPKCCNPAHLFLGTNQDNIADRMRKGRRSGPLPQNSNTAKLTIEDVREIRRLGKSVTRSEIAKRYGITVWHVSDIRTGDCWKNI